jgi:hypothetical protein
MKCIIHLCLLNNLGNGVSHEGISRFAAPTGHGRYAGLQFVLETYRGRGHVIPSP